MEVSQLFGSELKGCEYQEVRTFYGEKRQVIKKSENLNSTINYIERFLAASSLAEVHHIWSAVRDQFEFDFFTAVVNIYCSNGSALVFYMVDHLTEFTVHYEKQKYFLVDPGIRIAKSNATPCTMSTISLDNCHTDIERQVVLDARDYGVESASYFPFYSRRYDGIIRFERNCSERQVVRHSNKCICSQSELFVISSHIYSAITRLINSEMSPMLLGRREKEVLSQLASGLNPAQIGDLLNISENTVRNHLKNIRCKLGVRSITHAVAKAISENIIAFH